MPRENVQLTMNNGRGCEGFVGAKVRLFLSCGVIELWRMRLCDYAGMGWVHGVGKKKF